MTTKAHPIKKLTSWTSLKLKIYVLQMTLFHKQLHVSNTASGNVRYGITTLENSLAISTLRYLPKRKENIHPSRKRKYILILVKTIRKTLFKTIVIGVLQQQREIGSNSKYSKDSWGFIANEGSEGIRGRKTAMRRHQG